MSPRCTQIGAAMRPTTSASATAGLVMIKMNFKMNINLKMILTIHYYLNPERKLRILSEVMTPSRRTGALLRPSTLCRKLPPLRP